MEDNQRKEIEKLVIQVIDERLECKGVCNWKESDWNRKMTEEFGKMMIQHSEEIRMDASKEIIPQVSRQILDSQASIIEHFNTYVGESRRVLDERIDKAIESIKIDEGKILKKMEEISLDIVHNTVNGKLERISDFITGFQEWREGGDGELKKVIDDRIKSEALPLWIKSTISSHPWKFTSTIAVSTLVILLFTLKLFHYPLEGIEKYITTLLKSIF